MNTNTTIQRKTDNTPSREATRAAERFTMPPLDIVETANGLRMIADMPGASKNDIEISVDDDVLTIKGRYEASGESGRESLRREFGPVGYFRQFNLGTRIDQAKIRADCRHGVLEVNLPFAEKARPRKIEIKDRKSVV